MKTKVLDVKEQKTFALVFDSGDELASGLREFARENGLAGTHFTGIGALSDVTLGYFHWDTKKYDEISIDEQVGVLSLTGDIALTDGEPRVHAHLVVGKSDGTAHGGHLIEAHVRPALEVILVESPKHLHRTVDEATGLALLDLDKSREI
jgi:predicted DNA-binding protein with PD1-like motif